MRSQASSMHQASPYGAKAIAQCVCWLQRGACRTPSTGRHWCCTVATCTQGCTPPPTAAYGQQCTWYAYQAQYCGLLTDAAQQKHSAASHPPTQAMPCLSCAAAAQALPPSSHHSTCPLHSPAHTLTPLRTSTHRHTCHSTLTHPSCSAHRPLLPSPHSTRRCTISWSPARVTRSSSSR